MAEPGEYVSDITEGITCVEALPKAKIKRRSRRRTGSAQRLCRSKTARLASHHGLSFGD